MKSGTRAHTQAVIYVDTIVDVVVLVFVLDHRAMCVRPLRLKARRRRLTVTLQAVLQPLAVGIPTVPHFVLLDLRQGHLLVVVRQNVVVAVVHIFILFLG